MVELSHFDATLLAVMIGLAAYDLGKFAFEALRQALVLTLHKYHMRKRADALAEVTEDMDLPTDELRKRVEDRID